MTGNLSYSGDPAIESRARPYARPSVLPAMPPAPRAPYPRGYSARLDAAAAKTLKDLHKTRVERMIGRALATHAIIAALMLAFCWLLSVNVAVALLLVLPASVLVAREQRVLELLVHNASHRNWSRNRLLNDIAATMLAGLPMASAISAYWDSHRIHHSEFGSSRDPDRAGFEFLGPLDLADKRGAARWLVRYAIQYYRAIGSSPVYLAGLLAWHIVFYIAPLALLVGTTAAIGAWAALWLLPMLTTLSALRAIAEREEHEYGNGPTEFSATCNNLGPAHRLLFHPWHDHYHLLHHLYPGIPQYNHKQAHRLLMARDPAYRDCPVRLAILGAPVAGKEWRYKGSKSIELS